MEFGIYNENGDKLICNVVGFVNDAKTNINYIVYTDGTKNENDILLVYASRYIKEDDKIILKAIENDYEWDLIDKYLSNKNER